MKALVYDEFGPINSFRIADIPAPRAGAGEVLVEVEAIGLNFFDTLLVQGKYQVRPEAPFSPGGEFSGIVGNVGGGVTDLEPGDRVYGYLGHGAARESVVVDARYVVKLPDNLSFAKAAGMGITYGTSYYALRSRGELKAGETLAVLGAAGGVGLAAVELGKQEGARVIACASSDAKLAVAADHGADELLNYSERDLKSALRQETNNAGVDVIYDPVGGALAEPAIRSMAWNGRYLVIGFASGEIPRPALNLILLKGSALVGVFWGAWIKADPKGFGADVMKIASLCASGALKARVHDTYPLSAMEEALQTLATGKAVGKIIVLPRQ